MKAQKALITGVSGFVGPYLVRHLIASGFEVFGIDRNGSTDVGGCVVEQCDVTDYDALFAIVKRIRPDYIFHLAGQSSVAKSWDNPKLTMDVNVGGARNLFGAVAAAGISPKILLVSSAEVYGIPRKVPIAEGHPLSPISPYGESRVEQEKIALEHFRSRGAHVVIARSFNHTGPGQPSEFVCSNFAKQVAGIEKGAQPPVIKVGDLRIKRDFSDVRDVVRAYLLLLRKGVPGEAYNVCSGRAFAIGEILGRLIRISSRKVEVEPESSRIRGKVIPVLHGDNSKIFAATGWKPLISLDATLSDLLEYWRKLQG